jgi:hypothetical protein
MVEKLKEKHHSQASQGSNVMGNQHSHVALPHVPVLYLRTPLTLVPDSHSQEEFDRVNKVS